MNALVDAVVAAGGVPSPRSPFYTYTQGHPKALLPLAGQPMVQWVLDALSHAQTIRRVVVMGLNPQTEVAGLHCAKPLTFLPDHGSLVENLDAGARWALAQDAGVTHIFAVSGDLPAIRGSMVDWSVSTSLETDHDGYYSLIRRETMEQRYPGAHRTYFRFKEGWFTAGDMHVLSTRLLTQQHTVWERIVAARKSVARQASLIGIKTLLLFLLGQISIPLAEQRVLTKLGVRARVLICPYAEVGMDIDKLDHYHRHEAELKARLA